MAQKLRAFFADVRVWIGLSVLGVVIATISLVGRGQTFALPDNTGVISTSGPALVHFFAAFLGLLSMVFVLRYRWSPRLMVLVVVLILVGMLLSLFYRDDYSGGTCGPHDWPAGHLHAGYPYSWLDGSICVEPGSSIAESLAIHPEQQGWYPDFLALGVDGLFWLNASLLTASVFCLLFPGYSHSLAT